MELALTDTVGTEPTRHFSGVTALIEWLELDYFENHPSANSVLIVDIEEALTQGDFPQANYRLEELGFRISPYDTLALAREAARAEREAAAGARAARAARDKAVRLALRFHKAPAVAKAIGRTTQNVYNIRDAK